MVAKVSSLIEVSRSSCNLQKHGEVRTRMQAPHCPWAQLTLGWMRVKKGVRGEKGRRDTRVMGGHGCQRLQSHSR